MLAATEVKISGSEEIASRNTYDVSPIKRVTRKFHLVVLQNNGKEMCKKVCCRSKVVFLLRATKDMQLVLQHCCKTSGIAMFFLFTTDVRTCLATRKVFYLDLLIFAAVAVAV